MEKSQIFTLSSNSVDYQNFKKIQKKECAAPIVLN
jgi:hypothetical protein